MHNIDRTQGEFVPESNLFEFPDTELGEEIGPANGLEASVMNETEEMELASELLELTDEGELDQFLGKLFKKVSAFARTPTGRALGGFLKKVAKKALPIVGGAVGTYFGGPLGASLGSKIASGAGQMFGLELEGMSSEDQEFEVARRVVRLADAAIKRAVRMPSTIPPLEAARAAVTSAAKLHAPGLLSGFGSGDVAGVSSQNGRWIRRGRKIILFGV